MSMIIPNKNRYSVLKDNQQTKRKVQQCEEKSALFNKTITVTIFRGVARNPVKKFTEEIF